MVAACTKCNIHRNLNRASHLPQIQKQRQKYNGDPLSLVLVMAKTQNHSLKNMAKRHEVQLEAPTSFRALAKLCAKKFKDFKPKSSRIFACVGVHDESFFNGQKVLEVKNEETLGQVGEYVYTTAVERATSAIKPICLVLSGKNGWSMDANLRSSPNSAEAKHSSATGSNGSGCANWGCSLPSTVCDETPGAVVKEVEGTPMLSNIAPPTWILPDDVAELEKHIHHHFCSSSNTTTTSSASSGACCNNDNFDSEGKCLSTSFMILKPGRIVVSSE